MGNFENLGGRTFGYDPEKNKKPNPMAGKSGERLTPYYGVTLPPPIINEIAVWASVLNSIKDGIPKPYDASVIVNKIRRLEKDTGEDLTDLKNCCPPSSNFREAKEVKPFIFAILDRIVEIGGLEKYVEKHSI